jgi:hypothetical protein
MANIVTLKKKALTIRCDVLRSVACPSEAPHDASARLVVFHVAVPWP